MSGLAKGGTTMCLAYVVLMLFLPLFQLDCGVTAFEWTGAQLVTGSTEPLAELTEDLERQFGGAVETLGDHGASDDGAGGELPHDWALLALPGLALLGIASVLAGKRLVSTALITLLLGAFTWFTSGGFALERELDGRIEAKAAEEGLDVLGGAGGLQLETRKLPPYWIGFGATGLALLLVVGEGRPRRR